MIEIKDNQIGGGYSLEDLIATERENARLNLYYDQLYRIVNEDSCHMGDQIRLLFGWKNPKDEE